MGTTKTLADIREAWVAQQAEFAPVWSEELAQEMAGEEFDTIIKWHTAQAVERFAKMHGCKTD